MKRVVIKGFICTQCGKPCPHLRWLLDHYKLKHPDLLKMYHIKHPPSGSHITMLAPDIDTILNMQKWNKEDCKISEI